MGLAMRYRRIIEDDFKKARMVPEDSDLFKVIRNRNQPAYYSTFTYDETHKTKFEETGSVKGFENVKTNLLWWDFDSKNLEIARDSAVKLVDRLVKSLSLNENNIRVNFSGGKGFHVSISTDKELNPRQVKMIATKYAGDLDGFDASVYDSQRVLRAPLTRHGKSGLYCVPVTLDELKNSPIVSIQANAKSLDNYDSDIFNAYYKDVSLSADNIPDAVEEKKPTKQTMSFDIADIDLKARPKGFDEARWLLMNGFFRGSGTADAGERSYAFLCLASTLKANGYPIELARGVLTGVAETQSKRTGEDVFDEARLEDSILGQVYSPGWRGGTYTTRDPENWLAKYARKMGISSVEEDERVKSFTDTSTNFGSYIEGFENNPLKFGLTALDKSFPMPAGTNIGIVAAASAGKTLVSLKLLENASRAGMISVFASLDMSATRMFEKLLYRVTKGVPREELFKLWKDPETRQDLIEKVRQAYGNVYILNKSSATVEDIRSYIQKVEQQVGRPVELLMIDYFERVNSEFSDETKSSKMVAMGIQDLVNDMHNLRVITLYQPNKHAIGGGPDTPILSYTAIKGSSVIFQSCRQIISLWREFQSPEFKEHDHYISCAVLKNDLGELDTFTYGFSGKKGDIYELEDIQLQEFKELVKMKKQLKEGKKDNGWD